MCMAISAYLLGEARAMSPAGASVKILQFHLALSCSALMTTMPTAMGPKQLLVLHMCSYTAKCHAQVTVLLVEALCQEMEPAQVSSQARLSAYFLLHALLLLAPVTKQLA